MRPWVTTLSGMQVIPEDFFDPYADRTTERSEILQNPQTFLKFGKEHCSRSKGASRTGNHCASWTFLETVIQKEKLHADLGGTRLERPMCCRDSKDGITRKSGTPYDCAK